MKGPCTVEDCANPTVARGLCNRHYLRWKAHGDPTTPRVIPPQCLAVDPVQRFWSYVEKTTACWMWIGSLSPQGYGSFSPTHGRRVRAHRYAYELLIGSIPDGLQLDHTCHDPAACQLGPDCPHRRCVNPAHLEPVTARENSLRGGSPGAIAIRTNRCKRGHEFTPENTYTYAATGRRMCRTCHSEWDRQYQPLYRQRAQLKAIAEQSEPSR